MITPDLLTFENYPNATRLMKLNNPGGIYISKMEWAGKTTKPGQKVYESFDFYHNGIHAMLVTICNYYHLDRANTIEKLINKYARPGTPLQPYYEAVSIGTGTRSRQAIRWKREEIYLIISEMCRFENRGRNPVIHPDLFAFVWLKI